MLHLLLVLSFVIGFWAINGTAADKPPSCPEQLAQAAQHANNLTGDRNNKEYSLAKLQVELQQWKQQAAALQKQLDDLKKVEPEKKGE